MKYKQTQQKKIVIKEPLHPLHAAVNDSQYDLVRIIIVNDWKVRELVSPEVANSLDWFYHTPRKNHPFQD